MRVSLLIPFIYASPELHMLGVTYDAMTEPGMGSDDLHNERTSHRGFSAFSGMAATLPASIDGLEGRLLVGKLGVAAVAMTVELSELSELPGVERSVLQALAPELPAMVARCCEHAIAPTSKVAGSTAPAALWVHRIIVEPIQVERIVPLAYGTTCQLSRGANCIVGDGFSSATNVKEDHIAAIEDGLFAASQAWVVYDWLVSEASDLLESLDPEISISEGDDGAAKLTAGAARVAFTARKLTSFMRRQQQGVIDGRGVVYRAAIQTWGLEEELQSLVERADSYVEFVQLQASEMRSRSDRRRNILLFCLSFTAITQVLSGAYELLSGTATAIGPSPRPIIFFVTSAVTLIVLGLGLFYAMFVPARVGPRGGA